MRNFIVELKEELMKANRLILQTVFTLGVLASGSAFAAAKEKEAVSQDSHRMSRRAGMYLAYGDPYPTVLGISAAYQITDYLKASAGFGQLGVSVGAFEASTTTIGVGLKGMVPGWNLTPTVGLHFAHVSHTGGGFAVGGFTDSGAHVYTSFGFDWQTKAGFNLNGGYQLSFKSGIGGGLYLGAGWFVDWLG
jgi:hypothetical protein